jgi:predicted amidohydrolase
MTKIALAQMHIDYSDSASNIKMGLGMIRSAVENHCDMIVLPELWSTGFNLENRQAFVDTNQSLLQDLHEIAKDGKIEIVGSYLQITNLYQNEFIALLPDGSDVHYAKIHLFPGLQETTFLTPGKEICVYSSCIGSTGASICFDLRFPIHFQMLCSAGTDYHIIPAHWPLERIAHWDILLRARAVETLSYVIAVNSTGKSRHLAYGGHSSVISPEGEVIFQAAEGVEDEFIVEIDSSLVERIRSRYPFITRQ